MSIRQMVVPMRSAVRFETAEDFVEDGTVCPTAWAERIASDHSTTLAQLCEDWPPLAMSLRGHGGYHVCRRFLVEALGY